MIALIFVLHVIAVGIILNRLPLRIYTAAGFFLYFLGVYVSAGFYLKENRQAFTPVMPLEDDYYNHYRVKKKSPFEPTEGPKREMEEELQKERDDAIRLRKKKQDESKSQPSTKP